jgi:release factor glutamine methyltransferase
VTEETWRGLHRAASTRLGSELDARRILEEAAGAEPGEWVTLLDDTPVARQAAAFDRMVDRRAAGEPLQYVVGHWGFRRLDLMVDRRVLIPRPETEQVVEVALREVRRVRARERRRVRCADLGTGSGAIALSLADEAPDVEVWATDVSADAIDVARANLVGTGSALAGRVHLREGDWFDALPAELRGGLDLLVSNPPYVAEADDLPDEVTAWEPARALVAGPSGTESLAHLLAAAVGWTAPDGAIVLEIAPHQALSVADLAWAQGWIDVEVHPDLAGRDRAISARRPPEM